MNHVMTFTDFLGLKFSDIVDIADCVISGKSSVYESFDGSEDCYLINRPEDNTLYLSAHGVKSQKIQELQKLIVSSRLPSEDIKDQKIYCQVVNSKHYCNPAIYVYARSANDDRAFDNLKNCLKGKCAVRKSPKLLPQRSTITKRFISNLVKEIFETKRLRTVILKDAVDKFAKTRSPDEQEVIHTIYQSALETGQFVLLNKYNPDRHCMRSRRTSSRISESMTSSIDLNVYRAKVKTLIFKLSNIVLGASASSSNLYDNLAFKAQWNSYLRNCRKKFPEPYTRLCSMYCLDVDDDNPIKSTLSSVVIDCKKTGLFIKTPRRYTLFNDLEKLHKEKTN